MDVIGGDGQGGGSGGSGSGGCEGEPLIDFNALEDGFEAHSNWTGLDLGIDLRTGPGASDSIWNGQTSIPTNFSISEPPEPRTPSFDCEAEAFTALHSLHTCTMLHTDPPGLFKQTPTRTYTKSGEITDRMPPLDKVLYFNRAAISTLQELLDAPGFHRPHLALLYMTIVSKVLFWYRLIVSSQHQSKLGPRPPSLDNDKASNRHASPPSTCSNTTDRGVQSVSFQIGVFDLEDEDQKLLIKGVLLREVRKLEDIVIKMRMLGDEYTRSNECDGGQHGSSWYGVAGYKMQAEIQNALRQIEECGTGSAR